MREMERSKNPKNPEQILRETHAETVRLKAVAEKAQKAGNDNASEEALINRAYLIIDLPEKIISTVARPNGNIFPGRELNYLQGLSFIAQKTLLNDETGEGLNTLLRNVGGKSKEPDHLEQVIRRVYPPKKKK